MLQAQLKGKLTRTEENLEDLLTSNVFGSIKYISPNEGLWPLLISSEDSNGEAPVDLVHLISGAEYEFWPWIQEPCCEGCEPDVVINVRLMNGEKIIVFVEAKYLSDKSSLAGEGGAPKDQLAREWDNLKCRADREKATPILLYVTADVSYPKQSIEDSRQEYLRKRNGDINVFWISWRKLPRLFMGKGLEILNDLVNVLKRQRLIFFEGITMPEQVDIKWSFKGEVNWDWSVYGESLVCWTYQVNKIYNWQIRIEPFTWRFTE